MILRAGIKFFLPIKPTRNPLIFFNNIDTLKLQGAGRFLPARLPNGECIRLGCCRPAAPFLKGEKRTGGRKNLRIADCFMRGQSPLSLQSSGSDNMRADYE